MIKIPGCAWDMVGKEQLINLLTIADKILSYSKYKLNYELSHSHTHNHAHTHAHTRTRAHAGLFVMH